MPLVCQPPKAAFTNLLEREEGDLVVVAGDEPMADVPVGEAVVKPPVKRIHDVRAAVGVGGDVECL